MNNVFFKPRVGSEYDSGGMFGKKILVVGESHYCGNEVCGECGNPENAGECADFTTDTVNSYLAGNDTCGRWTSTFRKFERSMVGHETSPGESARIWDSIAFYNYLQRAMDAPRQVCSAEEFADAEQAFWEVMEALQPDVMIAWGVTRMYDNMPGGDAWQRAEDIVVDGYHVRNGWYTLRSGKRVRAIWVYHPSSGYSWSWWNKVIEKVL
jgi:hypothetical protein